MTKMLFTVLATTVVLAGSSAFAANRSETVTFTVSTAALDLRTPQGAQVMLRRIETAASAICGGRPYPGDLAATSGYKACVAYNLSQAVTQLDSPQVAEAAHMPLAAQTARNDH